MSNELYTVLGVTTEATTEEIRKAYKRRALETHPDRHPGQDKTIAEENFRKVNNAYEVLSDPEKRRIYDAEGVWPPRGDMHESSDGNRRPNGWPTDNNPFPNFSPFGGFGHDPFFSAFGPSRSPFGFSDPFDIFAAVFGDRHLNGLRGFGSPFAAADPFGGHPGSPFSDPFFTGSSSRARDPFGRMFGPMFPHSLLMDDMLGGRQGNGGMKTMSFSSSIAGQSNGSGPRWVSESRSMRTVNGVTETVVQKKDSEGNVHVERTYPDGRKTLTINGVEQATITNGSPNPPPAPIEYTRPDRSYGNPPTVGYADPARANYANDPSYHSSSAYYHRPRYEEPSYPATGQNLNNTYQQGQPIYARYWSS